MFEEAQSYFIQGRIQEEVVGDYSRAKEYNLVAYDTYMDAACLEETLAMVLRASELDRKMNEESFALLARKSKVFLKTNKNYAKGVISV